MDIFETWLSNAYICKYGFTDEENPENSLGAFEKAVKNKYAICLSVQSLKDETLICYNYLSLGEASKQSGYVCNLKVEDIKNCCIKGTKQTIPTLEQAFNIIKGKVPVLINLINNASVGKIESNLLKLINDYKGSVAIMSTNPESVEWFKLNAPNVLRGIRSGKFKTKMIGSYKSKHLTKLKYNNMCDPMFICYSAEDLPNRAVKKHKDLLLLAFNVKSEKDYRQVVKYSDNVIFNGYVPKI